MGNVVSYYDAYVEGETMWFSNLNYNALMRADKRTGAVTLVDRFPHYEAWRQNIHRKVIEFQGILYFIPFIGNIINIYAMETGEWDHIILDQKKDIRIVEAALIEGKLWLFPQYMEQSIFIIDLATKDIHILTEVTKELLDHRLKELDFTSISLVEGCFYIAVYNDYRIIKMQVETKKTEVISLPTNFRFQAISECKGVGFWLTSTNSNVVTLWNEQKGILREFKPVKEEEHAYRSPYIAVVDTKDWGLTLPCYSDSFYIMDKKNGTMETLVLPSDYKRYRALTMCTGFALEDEAILVYPRSGNGVLRIAKEDQVVENISLWLESEAEIEHQKDMLQQNMKANLYTGELRENIGWTEVLPEFFDLIQKEAGIEGMQQDVTAGKRIWTNVITEIRTAEGN